jgi:hypothetical protein
MADTKISAYPSGAPLQSSDQFLLAFSDQNYRTLAIDFIRTGWVNPSNTPPYPILWLQPSTLISLGYHDDDLISLWPDSSASMNDAIQTIDNLKPKFKVNQFGSWPGVRFDGIDDCLQILSINFLASSSFSIMAVAKTNANSTLLGNSTASPIKAIRIGPLTSGNTISIWNSDLNYQSDPLYVSPAIARVLCWGRRNPNQPVFYENGRFEYWSNDSGAMNFDRIGSVFGGTWPFNGDLAELIVWDRNVPDPGVFRFYREYFQWKYSIYE